MANPIIQAIYDLKDNISAKIKVINDALRGNQKETDNTAAASERGSRRISDSYKKTADSIGQLRTALAGLAAFVGLDKLKDGIESVVKAGEDLNDLQKRFAAAFGGLDAGADAFEKVRALAKDVPQTFEDVSDAAIALKKAGFDPLDGSLQALLDNANATNQSQEQLIDTIEKLGAANIKGAVNIKALVALTQAGVPVFDLLSKAMGVSADRVRQLAENGQLSQDSIKLLVTELGKLRAGAAADELGDFDSQLTKLKDTGREFLETIAKSGALDFFRQQIKALNQEVEDAAKSGKLQEIAKSISDGIVSTGSAIKSVIGFVTDYSGALIELAKTYAIFRTIDFAGSLLKGAAAMESTAKATLAAKGEAAATTGIFGKLGKTIGSLPSTIKLSIAAAAIEGALQILQALTELREAERELGDAESDRAETLAKLSARVQEVKTQYAAFADVAIESAEELKNEGAEQLKSYAEQLDGAKRFYQALVVEARTAGDAAGLENAKAHLQEVNAEIAAVNQQLAVTSTVGANAASGLSAGAAAIVAKLSEVKDDAKATGDLIEKAFIGFDFKSSIVEIGDFAAAFDTVAAKGGKAADTLNSTLLESLKKLSGDQLLQFQSAASAAIDGLGKDAAATSAVLQATLETALDRLGVKAEATGIAITKTGKDTIATFTAIAENAQATGQTIAAAFDAALAGAKTADEARALGQALQAAADTGKISLRELADAGRDLDERLRSITAAVSPLASQFDLLGIKSQAQLNATKDNAKEAFDAIVQGAHEGTAAQEDVVRAFKAWADAARAAGADSDQATKDQIEQQIALQASVFGLTDALGKSGDAGKDAGDKTAQAYDGAAESITNAKDAAAASTDALSGLGSAAQRAAFAQEALGTATQNTVIVTAAQVAQMRDLRDEVLRGSLSWQQYGDQVDAIFTGIDQDLAAEQEALQRFNDQLNGLQSQLASANGDDTEVENLRHQQKLADIKAETDLSIAQRRRLEQVEEQLHEANLKRIEAENDARANTDTNTRGGGAGTSPTPTSPTPAPLPHAPAPSVQSVFNIVLLSGDKNAVDQLGDLVARRVDQRIKEIARRSV